MLADGKKGPRLSRAAFSCVQLLEQEELKREEVLKERDEALAEVIRFRQRHHQNKIREDLSKACLKFARTCPTTMKPWDSGVRIPRPSHVAMYPFFTSFSFASGSHCRSVIRLSVVMLESREPTSASSSPLVLFQRFDWRLERWGYSAAESSKLGQASSFLRVYHAVTGKCRNDMPPLGIVAYARAEATTAAALARHWPCSWPRRRSMSFVSAATARNHSYFSSI